MKTLTIADLFCGAGGTSTGAVQAAESLGYRVDLTAVNHWERAVETHSANHPEARHYCASVDSLNPRLIFPDGDLDILWASPECTHHSRARGGKPMLDQSRATAWCVTRWAEALRPSVVMVENVPEFLEWGPLGSNGKPTQANKRRTFLAWVETLRAIGYTVDWKILCAADYGDPTTRRRLFVQAVRGRRRIVWPDPTHAPDSNLWGLPRWRSAAEAVIDWSIAAPLISDRKRPLAKKTMDRIEKGLRRYGGSPFVVQFRGTSKSQVAGSAKPVSSPIGTVSAGGIHHGIAFVVAMEHGGRTVSADVPLPTVTCAKGGAFALVVEYYGNGKARPVSEPLPTVTCNDRFGLIKGDGAGLCFRMLKPHELAAAQGFPKGYKFSGNPTEQVRQIGNAVPCGFARALLTAHLTQNSTLSLPKAA